MMARQQRGVVLLWVAVMLAVIAALAFAMTRQGAMTAQAVESSNDIAVAHYLAEAGAAMAKWRNDQAGCKSNVSVGATMMAGIGSFAATVSKAGSKEIKIVATGTTLHTGQFVLTRDKVVVHDTSKSNNQNLESAGAASDTYLSSDFPTQSMSTATYLEMTQGRTNALLQFSMSAVPPGSRVNSATLKIVQTYPVAGAPAAVSVHRLLQSWTAPLASWNLARAAMPWTTPGGDYDSGNIAVTTVTAATSYSWDITDLVDGWSNGTFPNNGLLLKPDGPMSGTRFASLDSTTAATPSVEVSFDPPC